MNYLLPALVIWLSATAFWSAIAYEGVAEGRGWPVGRWFAGPSTWLMMLAYIGLAGAIYASLVVGPWWLLFVLAIAANIATRCFLSVGPLAQPLSVLGTVCGVPAIAFIAFG